MSDPARGIGPPSSLVEYALEAMRNDLLAGRLGPGTHLTAEGVAADLGISHIPVREAFRFLEAQGHMVRDGRRGVYVAPLSPSEAEDIYHTRRLLETEANRLGIPNLTHADDVMLETLIGRMEAAAEAGALVEYRASNRAFHFIPFERSGRPWLVRFLRNLWDASTRYQAAHFIGSEWRSSHPLRHRAILGALMLRETTEVNRLMDDHRTILLQSLKNGTPTDRASPGNGSAKTVHARR